MRDDSDSEQCEQWREQCELLVDVQAANERVVEVMPRPLSRPYLAPI